MKSIRMNNRLLGVVCEGVAGGWDALPATNTLVSMFLWWGRMGFEQLGGSHGNRRIYDWDHLEDDA